MTAIWYAAVAQPNMDVRVARDLGDQGYWAFAPKMFEKIIVNGKAKAEAWLWLSPYVFVCVDDALRTKSSHEQSIRDVKATLGVVGVVTLGIDLRGNSIASIVPERIIRHYKHLENADYEAAVRRVRIKEPTFRAGDKVVVIADCEFLGIRGKVKEVRHRLVVIDPEGSGWPLVLPEDDLALDEQARPRRVHEAA
jgi:transcription antitermination factor NusG